MGLYKKNYEVKDLGITLPEAFAIVRKIDRQGNKGMAELWVHSSREKDPNVIFCGRIGGYEYINMDTAISKAISLEKEFFTYI